MARNLYSRDPGLASLLICREVADTTGSFPALAQMRKQSRWEGEENSQMTETDTLAMAQERLECIEINGLKSTVTLHWIVATVISWEVETE